MVKHAIAVGFFLFYVLASRFLPKKNHQQKRRPIKRYAIWLLECAGFLSIFFLLDREAFRKIDFNTLGKGFTFDPTPIMVPLVAGLIVRVVAETIRPELKRQTTEEERYSVFARAMPNTKTEFSLFVLTFIILVVYEELLFRQFLFANFFYTFHLKGDLLLVVSALLFTAAHSYKRIGPIAAIFISGLVFGKMFQLTGNLLYPIILHLLFNSQLIVEAILRMKHASNSALPPPPPLRHNRE